MDPAAEAPSLHDRPGLDEEILLERLSRAIETARHVHDDSRTPVEDAIALVPHLRSLTACRRALRRTAFSADAAGAAYDAAVERLTTINNTIKAELLARQATGEFVEQVSAAAAAVLDLACLLGALAI